ncbi:MAG: cation:proton antiporter [Syntrophothermus sp.]
MHQLSVLKILIIVFLISLPIIYIFRKIGLPAIVGFLIAGMLAGPHGFRLVTDVSTTSAMAEIGVILLLFTIGLELSAASLLEMKKLLIIAGGLQVLLTVIFSSLFFYLTGIGLGQSIFFGMLISLSSTAIVLKLLSEKNQLESPSGKISLSILVFQDLAIVPMMMILPLLGNSGESSFLRLSLNLLLSLVLLAVVILLARYFIPKILYQLARMRIREAFTIGTILIILATAFITESIGLSLALGAFIAGLVLSGTDYTHQVFADIVPMKDAFNSLFFVSIGLLFNFSFLMTNIVLVVGLTFGIILIKTLIVVLIVVMLRYPIRIAVLTGLGLAQIGEFSFVLAQTGISQNLMGEAYYNAFLSSSILTMLLTPLILELSPVMALGIRDRAKPLLDPRADEEKFSVLKNHVVIVGFGLNGKNIARVLKETGIKYVVLELNPETVKEYRGKGENILFGDATRPEVLVTTRIREASVIVFAISDPHSTGHAIRLARQMNPSVYCIVRTRFTKEVDTMLKAGADEVIPEEFETSLQIFTKVLQRYHIPLNIIAKQTNIIRSESYQMLRNEGAAPPDLTNIDKILAEGLTETYFVEESNPNVGKSLKDLNLRAVSGATVIAFMREGKTITNPSGSEKLLSNDTLVIYGNHYAVDKAIDILNK